MVLPDENPQSQCMPSHLGTDEECRLVYFVSLEAVPAAGPRRMRVSKTGNNRSFFGVSSARKFQKTRERGQFGCVKGGRCFPRKAANYDMGRIF